MDIEQRKKKIASEFQEIFTAEPVLWTRAPGRVDLMGSHTDYNEGYVLTEAIDRDIWIAARPREDYKVKVCSLNERGCGEFDIHHIEHDRNVPWTNYVRGVAAVMQQEGYPLRGFDGLIHSTVPIGSGLSSSAALEVSTAILFDTMSGLDINRVNMARMCQRAENEFVGMNCGILDQYSSLMGKAGCALLLDCRAISSVNKPIADGIQVVICDTRVKRELTGSEYHERRAQCEEGVRILGEILPGIKALRDVSIEQFKEYVDELPEIVARRCRFIIEENQRVLEIAEALARGNVQQISSLTGASFGGACRLYEICLPEMKKMMAVMLDSPGVIGARQAGAGFGGCMVAFVETEKVYDFAQQVQVGYCSSTGITPHIYPAIASQGAGLLPY